MKPHLQSVEREFTAHDRAISDVNWSNIHPEILVTSSLDTSIKIWDMRTGSKNVGIMSNWNGMLKPKFLLLLLIVA
jgi:WD40 repeat protein